jgi:hypothetical protein
MREMPVCIHCQKPIDKDKEEYTVISKTVKMEGGGHEDKWLYAHVECQRKQS